MLAGLAAMAAAPIAHAEAPPGAFLALGDWGYGGRKRQSDVAAAMGVAAAEIGSRFVLSVGDNFYPAGVQSVADPHWKTSFEDVYAAPSLQTPWFAALGNHDHRGSVGAQIGYSLVSDRWRMPSRYFKLSSTETGIPDLDIFVIDTTALLKGSAETFQQLRRGRLPPGHAERQVAWLELALRESSAPWKIVVGHHPIYSGGHHGSTPEVLARVEPLLEAHGVQAYLCGHDHALQHIRVGRVDYICTGAGASAGRVAFVDGLKFRGSRPGFASFRLADDALGLQFTDLRGRTLYQAQLERVRTAGAAAAA